MLLDDIATALETAGVAGGATGWALYKGILPDKPDKAVALYETPGAVPSAALALDFPGLQVRVRGPRRKEDTAPYSTTRAKIQEVFAALHTQEASVGAGYVFIYAANSGPLSMGYDASDRLHLSLNFRILKRRPA